MQSGKIILWRIPYDIVQIVKRGVITLKKKILVMLTVVAMFTLLVSGAAFAANADSAKAAAEKYVPAAASFVRTNDDGHKYEVHFNDNQANVHYEVEVNKFTGNVIEFKMESYNDRGSNVVKLSDSDIRAIIAKDFADASIYKIKLDKEHGLSKYEVSFTANGIRKAEYDINPETGNIIEKSIKY